ncbi:DNA polymerase III subunit chi [Glacieibacterium sp.]|uniref:DNA polymerase III subunit chi n=1 Tax=Glacieibacterium sp. TaxID=2860237 RepID=UPI003B002CBC
MTEVGFYQLASKPLDAVLPRLLEKAVAAGLKTVVRSTDAALLARLDGALWSYDPASFLPHAIDGDDAAAQPILLTSGEAAANDADLLAVVDGTLPGDLEPYKRVLYLFDGGDEDALALARRHWKALSHRDGVSPVYWKEGEGGRWEKAG